MRTEKGESEMESVERFKEHWMQTLPRSKEELSEQVRQIEIQEIQFKMEFICECLKMTIKEYILLWKMLLQNSELNREERLMLDVMNEMSEDFNSL